MKIGFNEGCNRFCENHSVLEDLDLCEKYGVDYIDISPSASTARSQQASTPSTIWPHGSLTRSTI